MSFGGEIICLVEMHAVNLFEELLKSGFSIN